MSGVGCQSGRIPAPGTWRPAPTMKRIHAVIKGTVQGVGYRYFAVMRAGGLDITGYARNIPGGDVEVVAEGEEENLEKFLELLRRGPSGAYVRDAVVAWLPATGEFYDFAIRY